MMESSASLPGGADGAKELDVYEAWLIAGGTKPELAATYKRCVSRHDTHSAGAATPASKNAKAALNAYARFKEGR